MEAENELVFGLGGCSLPSRFILTPFLLVQHLLGQVGLGFQVGWMVPPHFIGPLSHYPEPPVKLFLLANGSLTCLFMKT